MGCECRYSFHISPANVHTHTHTKEWKSTTKLKRYRWMDMLAEATNRHGRGHDTCVTANRFECGVLPAGRTMLLPSPSPPPPSPQPSMSSSTLFGHFKRIANVFNEKIIKHTHPIEFNELSSISALLWKDNGSSSEFDQFAFMNSKCAQFIKQSQWILIRHSWMHRILLVQPNYSTHFQSAIYYSWHFLLIQLHNVLFSVAFLSIRRCSHFPIFFCNFRFNWFNEFRIIGFCLSCFHNTSPLS